MSLRHRSLITTKIKEPFIIEVDTRLGDGLAQMKLPIQSNAPIIINTSDGQSLTVMQTALPSGVFVQVDFPTSGIYQIEMFSSSNVAPFFDNQGDKLKLTKVKKTGCLEIKYKSSFYGCTNMTWLATQAPIITSLDLSETFMNCKLFNGNINNWNVSNVTSTNSMFLQANVFNQPLDNWNVSNITNMSFMFYFAFDFNQPLNNWDVSNVTDMSWMFGAAFDFNQPLNNWNTANVTNMYRMFGAAYVFNQPLNNWNTANVTNMNQMFRNTYLFDQDISSWCVQQISTKPIEFDLNTPSTWIESEKPNWGVSC